MRVLKYTHYPICPGVFFNLSKVVWLMCHSSFTLLCVRSPGGVHPDKSWMRILLDNFWIPPWVIFQVSMEGPNRARILVLFEQSKRHGHTTMYKITPPALRKCYICLRLLQLWHFLKLVDKKTKNSCDGCSLTTDALPGKHESKTVHSQGGYAVDIWLFNYLLDCASIFF